MSAIQFYLTVFLLCLGLPVALLAAKTARPRIACPEGKNYPKFCPRAGDGVEQTSCCLTADNRPDCCKAPVAAPQRKVTICPENYTIKQCPGKGDPDRLNICCRFIMGTVATDACCSQSWVMDDSAAKSPIEESCSGLKEDVKYWKDGVIVLGVLFSLVLIAALASLTCCCCGCCACFEACKSDD